VELAGAVSAAAHISCPVEVALVPREIYPAGPVTIRPDQLWLVCTPIEARAP